MFALQHQSSGPAELKHSLAVRAAFNQLYGNFETKDSNRLAPRHEVFSKIDPGSSKCLHLTNQRRAAEGMVGEVVTPAATQIPPPVATANSPS